MIYKAMTFNLLYGGHDNEPTALENRKPKILELIQKEQPDLIGCQEALGSMRRWMDRNLNGTYAMVGCGRSEGCHGESVPVFYKKSRFALLSLETFWLSETPDVPGSKLADAGQDCPRLAHILRLMDLETQQRIRFVNTHLDCGASRAREWELNCLEERIGKISPDELFIMTGDFNFRPEEAPMRSFLERMKPMGVRDVAEAAGGTLHDFGRCNPPIKIDYIFSNGEAGSVRIVPDEHPDGVWYSDHYAVCAELFAKQ